MDNWVGGWVGGFRSVGRSMRRLPFLWSVCLSAHLFNGLSICTSCYLSTPLIRHPAGQPPFPPHFFPPRPSLIASPDGHLVLEVLLIQRERRILHTLPQGRVFPVGHLRVLGHLHPRFQQERERLLTPCFRLFLVNTTSADDRARQRSDGGGG